MTNKTTEIDLGVLQLLRFAATDGSIPLSQRVSISKSETLRNDFPPFCVDDSVDKLASTAAVVEDNLCIELDVSDLVFAESFTTKEK